MRRTAALILGGGPAGSAAAILLARGGVVPTVLERTREPADALCGGFLSWRSLAALRGLGIEADDLNPQRIDRLRLFNGKRVVESALPAPALAVSRRRLDSVLLDQAREMGASVERGVTVRRLESDQAHLADGGKIAGDAVVLATGKHELRGAQRQLPQNPDPALGLRVRLGPAPGLDRLVGTCVELHLVAGGYAGVARQEDGSVNLCLAIRRSRLHAAGSPGALLSRLGEEAPAFGERLAWMTADPTIDAVANVPYGWRTAVTEPGVFRLGDQAGVIPSLAGEGMGIAIASGTAAAQAILHGTGAQTFQRRFAATLARPMAVAGAIRRLAEVPLGAAALMHGAAIPGVANAVARLTRIRQCSVDER